MSPLKSWKLHFHFQLGYFCVKVTLSNALIREKTYQRNDICELLRKFPILEMWLQVTYDQLFSSICSSISVDIGFGPSRGFAFSSRQETVLDINCSLSQGGDRGDWGDLLGHWDWHLELTESGDVMCHRWALGATVFVFTELLTVQCCTVLYSIEH